MATTKQMVEQVGALVLLTTLACGPETPIQRPAGDPTPLVNEILSLASPTEVKQRPEFAGTRWVEIENSRTRKPSKSARFDDYVIMASEYTVGGVSGSLRLEFLNGLLLGTWFYPSDFQKCIDELAATGISFPPDSPGSLETGISRGNTTIRLGKDYEGRRYVAWEDSRLVDAMNQWLMRNS
jgi:hypothetical protein